MKAEIIKALREESTFTKELLVSMVAESKTKCLKLQRQFEEVQAAYNGGQTVTAALSVQYDDIISWAGSTMQPAWKQRRRSSTA